MNKKGFERLLAIVLMLALTLTLAAGCGSEKDTQEAASADSSIEAPETGSTDDGGQGAENTPAGSETDADKAETENSKDKDTSGKDDKKPENKDQTSGSASSSGSSKPSTSAPSASSPAPAPTPTPAPAPEENKPSGSGHTGASPAAQAVSVFNSSVSSGSVTSIANRIAGSGLPFEAGVTSVEEGFLNGFSENITGFSNGACVAPYIGSIPYIAYVFESDDPQALASLLRSKADLRWNVCTMADEMKCTVSGNYVFFVMAPASFDE